MIPRTVPDPEDRLLLKDKHPHYIAGWNKVKHQHHPRPNKPIVKNHNLSTIEGDDP